VCEMPWASHQSVAGKVRTGKKSTGVLFDVGKMGLLVRALKWNKGCGSKGRRHYMGKWCLGCSESACGCGLMRREKGWV
jgi:hypothetical protein